MADRSTFARLRCLSVTVLAAVLCIAAEPPRIIRDGGVFRVIGWNAPNGPPLDGWVSVFAVHAGSADAPSMLGEYSSDRGALSFRPRFRVAADVAVVAVFRPPGGVRTEIVFPAVKTEAAASTKIVEIYPTAGVVPANLLKFYLHFSAPMQRGGTWDHIRLLDASGRALDLPFLEIDQELWDAENRRLTILFDPGRIKRGVLPREQGGTALEAGREYRLAIDSNWRDSHSLPLAAPFEKKFRVAEEDRTPLDSSNWKVHSPAAGSRHALAVELPEAADAALLRRMLTVNFAGQSVEGSVSLSEHETRWQFVPSQSWRAGDYKLVIDTALEDLAGNKVGRAFDVDVFDRVTKRLPSKTVSLAFRIGLD